MARLVQIDALVFDFDGLVADTERPELEAWRAVYADHDAALTMEEWAVCIGTVDAFDPHDRLEALVGRRLDRDRVAAQRRDHYARLVADGVQMLPGVTSWLAEAAARDLPVAIASSSPPSWVERHLSAFGLLDAFVHLSCYDGSCPAKPAPDLYRRAIDAIGVDPERALALEDSPNGTRAAKAAGLWCVAVPHDLTRDLDLSAADLVIDSLATTSLDDVAAALSRRSPTPPPADRRGGR